MFQAFVILLCIGGIARIVVKAFTPKPAVRLVISPSGLVDDSGLSLQTKRDLKTFFERDVRVVRKVTITGTPDSRGRLRFTFRGEIDQGTQQQIRNYLHTQL